MTEPKRTFPLALPRRWRNKQNGKDGKDLKVLPWFQPIDNESRFDFKGMLSELVPEFKNDVMGSFEAYSGLVVQVGWLVENENRIWIGLIGIENRELFEDLGPWNV